MLYLIRVSVFGFLCLSFFAVFFSCSKTPSPVQVQNYGTLEIRANVISSTLKKETRTEAESLVVEVSGEGIDTVFMRKLDLSRPALSETITRMPVGKNLRISIRAISKNGVITHIDSLKYHTVTIEDAKITPIVTTLIPAAGSIYLQFTGLRADADSIHASFISADESFRVKAVAVNTSKITINLDYIPHGTEGLLSVVIKDKSGDTLNVAVKELTFNARGDNNIQLTFTTPGGSSEIEITLYEPGVTMISHDFKSQNMPLIETGELIITEIMWNAADSNYVELYNTTNDTLFFDPLTTDVDGTVRHYMNVKIAPHGYLVIGRRSLPYADLYPTTSLGFNITNTGNWITIKRADGTIINQIFCGGGSYENIGWPKVSGKRSIELARDKYNAQDNKLGKNWRPAAQRISDDINQYGTPGF